MNANLKRQQVMLIGVELAISNPCVELANHAVVGAHTQIQQRHSYSQTAVL
jgi:hypothetical protein